MKVFPSLDREQIGVLHRQVVGPFHLVGGMGLLDGELRARFQERVSAAVDRLCRIEERGEQYQFTTAGFLLNIITYGVVGVRSDGFFTGGILPASTTTA